MDTVDLSILVHFPERKVYGTLKRLWFDGCEFTTNHNIEGETSAELEIHGLGRIRGNIARVEESRVIFHFSSECPV
ncbi:hypothetical protein G7076_04660 [Sphingomonas sp. HDW15A]|uniref:hypothetical protein n=1 Tax=Sphingomonas sp. HDW15A TaxID=2714942 RepID=UPI00140E00AE|nr:hypothetical protein [Sphingomonas sp. HDW15A]QIK95853.1 hypothetical protein G7076_04660 [Sphingomonas sp. HDW15A]